MILGAVSLVIWFGVAFTLAGGANGLFSWLVYLTYLGQSFRSLEPGMLLSSVIGGLAGGYAYWMVTGRSTADWRAPRPILSGR